tara:strand:+ start:1077 stop:1256 length:180 start_codon:yes stop_codon:yes gene_type:complete
MKREPMIEMGRITIKKLSAIEMISDFINRLILLLIGYKKIENILANNNGNIIVEPMYDT